MKVTDETLICPYTGLRSFTEEESLYFKGRDEQIDKVAKLLEQNKFLMLTGASGEGKSSLIYAGLIPNARAGFFKAKYTNWTVADFRPERSPVKNMANAIAGTFNAQPEIIETELRRGFSSLIDLYVNSSFYTDESDLAWQSLDAAAKKDKTRSAANLLIIVDQFEEFFTNPENYVNGAPSQESQIVVNLALETARIALQRNLPVYVVCTMRSDYIGQCSAFRGLPEYIGFSQFFVPRLRRQEIKQVIEEPALLSGNRITRRLVERIVYDLADGIDQLPILQHALRQVWLAASEGREEMDLIHYAKSGGMAPDDLPADDQKIFSDWFSTLPENQKQFYVDPGLNKIIEIHANGLYERAWIYYNESHPGQPVTQKDARRIIALTFACLTKIDDSRAVRNRMTLLEITNIINQPGITTDVVGGVLNLFRESNNSFIRPYKTDDVATHTLQPDTVLDITHESLIRNWALLNKWANQEFEFYTTFIDFRKQLVRWKDSNESAGFLLPLGPLTFFENWYMKARPNAWWIDRYAEDKHNPVASLRNSEATLADTKEFIRRSARRVSVTRAFMKYGARTIAIGVAAVLMIFVTGFYLYDARKKTNTVVQADIVKRVHVLLKSKDVDPLSKSFSLLMEERLKPGTLLPYLKSIQDRKDRLQIAVGTYRCVLYFDKYSKIPLKTELMNFLLTELNGDATNLAEAPFVLEQRNQFILLLAYDEYFNPNSAIAKDILPKQAEAQHQLANYLFVNQVQPASSTTTEINLSIQHWLTFGHPSQAEIKKEISLISPFADSSASHVFNKFYLPGAYESNGRISSAFNGGYQTISSLYAAAGDFDHVLACFKRQPESYFRTTIFNNYTNLLGYFHQYHHEDQLEPFLKWLSANHPTDDAPTVYRNAILRSGHLSGMYGINLIKYWMRSHEGYLHPNLMFSTREQFFDLVAEYEKRVESVKNADEKHYLLASHYKRVAALYNKYLFDRNLPADQKQMDAWLDKAWVNFKLTGDAYLDEIFPITVRYYTDGIRNLRLPRRNIFLYPDYRDGWFSNKYNGPLFMDYCSRKGLLKTYYNTSEGLGLIHEWISASKEQFMNSMFDEASNVFQNDMPIPDDLMKAVMVHTAQSPARQSFDGNLPNLIMANRSFDRGDTTATLHYFGLLDKETLAVSRMRYEYLSQTYFINQLVTLAGHLADMGHTEKALELSKPFELFEKGFFYSRMADELYKTYRPETFQLLDSLYRVVQRVDVGALPFANPSEGDGRTSLAYLMGEVGGEQAKRIAINAIRELPEQTRSYGLFWFVYGTSKDGSYFTALSAMPPDLTESSELICYEGILMAIARQQPDAALWAGMDRAALWDLTYVLIPT